MEIGGKRENLGKAAEWRTVRGSDWWKATKLF